MSIVTPVNVRALFGYSVQRQVNSPAQAPGIPTNIRNLFNTFTEEYTRNVGALYRDAFFDPKVMPIVRRYAAELDIELNLLLYSGVLLACLIDAMPADDVSLAANNIRIRVAAFDRPLTENENYLLELLAERVNASGIDRLRDVDRIPGVEVPKPRPKRSLD